MGPLTEKFVLELEAGSTLLSSAGERHWAKWLSTAAARLRRGDFSGIEYFEGAFGGMGSINDLVICQMNGHCAAKEDESKVNAKLQSHLAVASNLANKVRENASF